MLYTVLVVIDFIVEFEETAHYPSKFRHTPKGILSHDLHIKIGAPVMLLWNLIPPALVTVPVCR